ncbi:MAG: M1 family metallopeptidase, partial [Sphingomonadales bacterium]|nr:M1 family metallopeptidase [Sphingomonadales bacterium]
MPSFQSGECVSLGMKGIQRQGIFLLCFRFFGGLGILLGGSATWAQPTEQHGCAEAKLGAMQRSRLWNESGLGRVAALNRGADAYDIHYYRFDLNVTTASTALNGNVLFRAIVLQGAMDTFWFELRSFLTIDSVVFN